MKIRKINIDDLEKLRNLSIQTFKETFEEVNTEEDMQKYLDINPNSAIEKKEYFSILISNCVAVEKNKR